MTPVTTQRDLVEEEGDISLLALGTILLRGRRIIIGLGVLGALWGLSSAIRTPRMYMSEAIFLPQASEATSSGLAIAASQFGLRVPSTGGAWGPGMYVELLGSRALLEPIVSETVVVAEERGRRVAVADLVNATGKTPQEKIDRAVEALRGMVRGREVRALGGVGVSVTSPWPSVSLELARKVIQGVNDFNLQTRKSQATAEREFVQELAAQAERSLRNAEENLRAFTERNRAIGNSPQLSLERDRLQAEVDLQREVYTTLLESREEARIREVRDTPVITVFDQPRLALAPLSRGILSKTFLGGLFGGVLGIVIAFFADAMRRVRQQRNSEAEEFFKVLEDVKPTFMRRKSARP